MPQSQMFLLFTSDSFYLKVCEMIACPSQKYRIKRNTKQCSVIDVTDDKILGKGQEGGKKNSFDMLKCQSASALTSLNTKVVSCLLKKFLNCLSHYCTYL